MAAISTMIMAGVAVAGAATAGVGVAMQMNAAEKMQEAQEQQVASQQRTIALQQKQEDERQAQMKLDAERKRREIVRSALQARAQAVSTIVGQGAGIGSSALGGAYGGIAGRMNVNELGVNQNEEIGNNMFALNRQIGAERSTGAYWQGQYAIAQGSSAFGAGLVSLGGMAMQQAGTIGKIGESGWNYMSKLGAPTSSHSSGSNFDLR